MFFYQQDFIKHVCNNFIRSEIKIETLLRIIYISSKSFFVLLYINQRILTQKNSIHKTIKQLFSTDNKNKCFLNTKSESNPQMNICSVNDGRVYYNIL